MTTPESSSAFELLHPAVQRRLWDMRWESLRPLQAAGIRAVLQTDDHLILSAPTAAGKTEAVFLPILSAIAADFLGSVKALYVGPLKALINDQFARLGELCTHLEVPVHHWHGDVAANKKTRLLADPGGVLLITPESIESLFINRPSQLGQLFAGLRFVVIDELHTFLASARGLHLRSLLCRLTEKVTPGSPPRLIGLSATLGDADVAKRFLSPDAPERVTLLEDAGEGKELKLRVHTYMEEPPDQQADDATEPTEADAQLAHDIVRHCRGASNLVFANSRADVEELGEACARIGREQRLPDRFLVHHGSLAAGLRLEAEEVMKSGQVATTFCSSTLELGVDIGGVRTVGQVDPPWSVASLKQRLGRSGRGPGEAQILRQYVRLERPGPKADLFDRLHLPLIQALAVTELLLEKWVEPPAPPSCDLSTLTHQVMSVIGERGGARADAVYQQLCVRGPFRDVSPPLFARLLRQLASRDVLEQMPEGDMILGRRGEAILRHYSFYAVFATPESFTLLHEGEILGTLDIVPEVGDYVLFAARRWEVRDVDRDNRVVMVIPARGRRRPLFSGGGGGLHPRIVSKMQEVLDETSTPAYLDEAGARALADARKIAAEARLCTRPIIPLSPTRTALLTWAGDRVDVTLLAVFRSAGVSCRPTGIGVVADAAVAKVRETLAGLRGRVLRPEELAPLVRHEREPGKYAWMLGEGLMALAIGTSVTAQPVIVQQLAELAEARDVA